MSLSEKTSYKLAVLKKCKHWYIEYWAAPDEFSKMIRFRPTFQLNRVKDLKERERLFLPHLKLINHKLPLGFPFVQVSKSEVKRHLKKLKKKKKKVKKKNNQMSLMVGIQYARDIKMSTNRKQSKRTYSSKAKIFLQWSLDNDLRDEPLKHFKKKHAVSFCNYIVLEREVNESTFNNYLTFIKGYFEVLKKSKYIKSNPFDGIKRKVPGAKIRRAFSDYEKSVVAKFVRHKYPLLFLGIILQYYCFIRPDELRRLKIGDIDLTNQMIRLKGHQTKNKKDEVVTIPDVAVPLIKETKMLRYPDHFFLFGYLIYPHSDKPCGERSLNAKQRSSVLKVLQKKGELMDLTGLSFYSWKDTGAYQLVKQKVNIREIQKQLRHSSLEITQRYCEGLYSINKEIKVLDNPLI